MGYIVIKICIECSVDAILSHFAWAVGIFTALVAHSHIRTFTWIQQSFELNQLSITCKNELYPQSIRHIGVDLNGLRFRNNAYTIHTCINSQIVFLFIHILICMSRICLLLHLQWRFFSAAIFYWMNKIVTFYDVH